MTKIRPFAGVVIASVLLAALAASPVPAQTAAIEIREIKPFAYVCAPYKGPYTDMAKAIGILMQGMRSQNLFPPLGPMIGVYYDSPATTKPEALTWEVGFPIAAQANPLKPLEKKAWTYTTVAVGTHVGSYEKTGEMIDRIMAWIATHGYQVAGPVLEKYLDMDPSKVKEEELRTEVWIPCRKK